MSIEPNKKYSMKEAAELMEISYQSLYGRVLRRIIPAEITPEQKSVLGKTILDFKAGLLGPAKSESEVIEIEGIHYRRVTPDDRARITVRIPHFHLEEIDKIASARKTHRNHIIEGALSAFIGRFSRG